MNNNDFEFNYFGFDKLNFVAKNLTDILFGEAEELSISSILEKICVSPPYFAFKKIYRYKNILIAQITPEQPIDDEIVTMSIGEAGRHMAILGTCACALDQEEKYYYLVKDAKITLETRNISSLCNKSNLYIAVETGYVDKKIATTNGILFNDKKNAIYHLNCSYNKIKTAIFNKLFAKYRSDTIETKNNPYKEPILFDDVEAGDNKLFSIMPEISKERCVGHFREYPILPTAFVIYNLLSHAGNFLLKRTNKKRYYISEVHLSLFELLYLSSKKEIRISYLAMNDNFYKMNCKIIQDGKQNSHVSFLIHCI